MISNLILLLVLITVSFAMSWRITGGRWLYAIPLAVLLLLGMVAILFLLLMVV